jgi:hypothetical protein
LQEIFGDNHRIILIAVNPFDVADESGDRVFGRNTGLGDLFDPGEV